MWWSKRERDLVTSWDRNAMDGHFLNALLNLGADRLMREDGDGVGLQPIGQSVARLRAELERRGFDPDTFTISVRRKRQSSPPTTSTAP